MHPIQHRRQGSGMAAPSSSRPQEDQTQQPLCYRQLLQHWLQKKKWDATFTVDSTGPQHEQKWCGSFWIEGTRIGQSGWHSSKGAAKEEAAQYSLAWLEMNYPTEQPNNHQEHLRLRLRRYDWAEPLHIEGTESPETQQWRFAYWIGRMKIGQSSWHDSPEVAKEEAAKQSIIWCNAYGYHGPLPSCYQQVLLHRLQEYGLKAQFYPQSGQPSNGSKWRISYKVGTIEVGGSEWHENEDAAKEEAAQRSLLWLNQNGYPGFGGLDQ